MTSSALPLMIFEGLMGGTEINSISDTTIAENRHQMFLSFITKQS
jgi:hypothetical protein